MSQNSQELGLNKYINRNLIDISHHEEAEEVNLISTIVYCLSLEEVKEKSENERK